MKNCKRAGKMVEKILISGAGKGQHRLLAANKLAILLLLCLGLSSRTESGQTGGEKSGAAPANVGVRAVPAPVPATR